MDTLKYSSGTRSRSRATTVDLPTAEGPAKTISRPLVAVASGGTPPDDGAFIRRSVDREVTPLEQCTTLAVTETTQTTRRGDLQLGHDLLSLDLADLGQSLQQCRHLHLAEDLVGLGVLEHLLEIGASALQPLLELSPGATG